MKQVPIASKINYIDCNVFGNTFSTSNIGKSIIPKTQVFICSVVLWNHSILARLEKLPTCFTLFLIGVNSRYIASDKGKNVLDQLLSYTELK